MASASDFKVKKGLQVQGGDVNLGGGDTAGEIQVDARTSGVGLDLTISAGESQAGAGGSLKLRTAATTSLVDRLVISPTATTISDGAFDFTIASHDGSNGLKLGSTLVTSTGTELNIMDGGTSSSTVTVAAADRVVLNDGGTMKQVSVNQLAAYYDDAITSMPNLTTAAALTSVGTLTALTVDDVAINGKVITMTGSPNDTTVMTAGTNGTLSIVTTDTNATAANIQITADGTVDIDSAGALTLDSGAGILLEPATGSVITLDGTITVDAGVVASATSITSTSFTGALTGNADTATLATTVTVTDNESTNEENALVFTADADSDGGSLGLEQDHSGLTYNPSTGRVTATQLGGTLTTVAQGNVTSLGTLTTLAVDDVAINGKVITITGDSGDTATFTGGAAGKLDIVTADASGTDAHIQITANGTAELAGTTVTLDGGAGGVTIDADSGTITFADDGVSMGTITSSGYSGYAKADTVRTVLTQTTDASFFPTFVDAYASGDRYVRTDDNFLYNPNTSHLTVDLLSGTLQTAAQTSVTSLGTLSALVGTVGDLNWDAKTLWVDSSENGVGIGPSSQINAGVSLTVMGAVSLKDAANPSATDVGGYGQLWVKDVSSNNQLYFTTDGGTDIQLTSGTAIASGGAADSVMANDIAVGDDNVRIYSGSGDTLTLESNAAQLQILTTNSGELDITAVAALDINAVTSTYDATTSHTLTSPVSAVAATTSHTITSPLTAITATTSVTATTPLFSIESGAANKPVVQIKNTNNGTDSAELKFVTDDGQNGLDGDDLGTISFYGDNDAQQQTKFAQILAEVSDASDGEEGGQLSLGVATHDGEMQYGLVLSDGSAEDEIDVRIGSGSSSVTTISGDLTVSGTTTTISSTVLEVTDDLITVSKGNDTLANAEGSGIEIACSGADNPTLTYQDTPSGWESNVNMNLVSGKSYKINDVAILTNTTLNSSVTSGAGLVTVGALNAGSITSGFTSIDVGAGAISTTGLITGGSLDIDDVLINGTTIGHTDDTDLLTVADGALTLAGTLNQEGITLIDSYSATLTTTSATTMFTFASNAYSAAKVIVSVWRDDSDDYRTVTEFLLTYRGDSTPAATSKIHLVEYAIVESLDDSDVPITLGTFDAVKSTGDILVQFTPATNASTKVRAQITQFVI